MNFEDEPYVRLYVRDTKTWLRLGFEGQCVLMFLLRKLDKAGVLDGMDDLDSDVALVTGVPEAIVAVGMPRLVKWGVLQLAGNRLIMPNYIQAQNAIRTDKARQRDMREKRLSQARLVTPRDALVTPRDETSREPTPDDAVSRDVTLYCPDLYSSDHSLSDQQAHSEPSQTEPPTHIRIPEGWNAPEELFAEAFAAGVTRAGLEEAVRYWRGRKLGGEWFTPEDFFRGKFAAIKLREESARFAEQQKRAGPKGGPRKTDSDLETNSTTSAATAFRPSTDHERLCAEHKLDLAFAVKLYRGSPEHDQVGFAESERRFLARLKCWAATGTFHPDGPLPKPKKPPGRAGDQEAA